MSNSCLEASPSSGYGSQSHLIALVIPDHLRLARHTMHHFAAKCFTAYFTYIQNKKNFFLNLIITC